MWRQRGHQLRGGRQHDQARHLSLGRAAGPDGAGARARQLDRTVQGGGQAALLLRRHAHKQVGRSQFIVGLFLLRRNYRLCRSFFILIRLGNRGHIPCVIGNGPQIMDRFILVWGGSAV